MEFYVSLIPLVVGRKRREGRCIHNGAKGGIIESGITTSLSDLRIPDGTIAQNIERYDHRGSGGRASQTIPRPLFRDSLDDQICIGAKAVTENTVRSDAHSRRAGLLEHGRDGRGRLTAEYLVRDRRVRPVALRCLLPGLLLHESAFHRN